MDSQCYSSTVVKSDIETYQEKAEECQAPQRSLLLSRHPCLSVVTNSPQDSCCDISFTEKRKNEDTHLPRYNSGIVKKTSLLDSDSTSSSASSWFSSPSPSGVSSKSNSSSSTSSSSAFFDHNLTSSTVSLSSCISESSSTFAGGCGGIAAATAAGASTTGSLRNVIRLGEDQVGGVAPPVKSATAANKSTNVLMGQSENSSNANMTIPRGCLREHNRQSPPAAATARSSAELPYRIRLPDGEEANPKTFRQYQLHYSPEDAILANMFTAPPNRVVNRTVCENRMWKENHLCPGDRLEGAPPPPYGCTHIALSPPSMEQQQPPAGSKKKLKEVMNSVLDLIIPASIRNSRRQHSDGQPLMRSSSCHAENRRYQNTLPGQPKSGTSTPMDVRELPAPLSRNAVAPPYCYHGSLGNNNTEYSGDPPPYSKVAKEKKTTVQKNKKGGK